MITKNTKTGKRNFTIKSPSEIKNKPRINTAYISIPFFLLSISILFYFSLILGCKGAGKKEEKSLKEFTFNIYYTKRITEINCFSVQMIKFEELKPFIVLSGFFTADLSKQDTADINNLEVQEKEGEWRKAENEDIKINIRQGKLVVRVKAQLNDDKKTYLELRGFKTDPTSSCESIYQDFRKNGFSDKNIAIGRSKIFYPSRTTETNGILSLVFLSDEFPYNLTLKRAFPLVIELYENIDNKISQYLICGGIDTEKKTVLRTCEIFDTEKIELSDFIPMNFPRVFASATKLKDGKIVISGGLDKNFKPIPYFEILFPEFNLFLKITGSIPRFLHYTFSTEKNIGILGGVGEGGEWKREIETFPLSTTEEEKIIKNLYILDNAGKFGSCFAENQNYIYIIGGVNSNKIFRLKKERIDVGTIEADEYQIDSLNFSPDNLQERIRSIGQCQAITFGDRVLVAGNLGFVFFFTADNDGLKLLYSRKIPGNYTKKLESGDEEIQVKKKKSFTLQKLSFRKAVIFGGVDYIKKQTNTITETKIEPSKDIYLIDIFQLTKEGGFKEFSSLYTRQGGIAFLLQDEYLAILGGTEEGKAEIIFVGEMKYPSAITELQGQGFPGGSTEGSFQESASSPLFFMKKNLKKGFLQKIEATNFHLKDIMEFIKKLDNRR
jgi:hypothetical protein